MSATRRLAFAAFAVALTVVGLGTPPAAPAASDLTTFGYGNSRLGSTSAESADAAATGPQLRTVWRSNVGSAVNTQPVVAHAVVVGGLPRNLVYVGTEHGQVVALDAGTGQAVWRRQLGSHPITPSCMASPDGRFGVTATFALDPRAGRLYAVDVNGLAWALTLDSGRVIRGWPVRVHPAGGADFVWGALALSRGQLYVSIASLCDAGRYHGGLVAIDVATPRRSRTWRPMAGTRAYAGGIWGWGGVSVDDQDGDVYAATGNSLGTAVENDGYGERVVRLSQDLRVEQSNYPLLGPFGLGDRDFGTTPVLFRAAGCPPQLVAINKTGELFLYDRDHVSSGPRQRLRVAAANGPIPLYGLPAFEPASRTLVLISPTAPPGGGLVPGVRAFRLTTDCRLAQLWQQAWEPHPTGSVAIAGGVVYINTERTGFLRAFRVRDGHPLWSRVLSSKGVFARPAVVDGTVFAADWAGRVWAFRPGPPAESGGHTWRYVLGGILLVIAATVLLTRRRRRR